ncbi:MAG: hypothetical protein HWN66_21485 [Candidatus Helarchaeota archaeon]|nr:hypothetical protein [Candidatus Helarchaeota archaeon]
MEKCACVRWDVIEGKKVLMTDENTNHLAIPKELLEKYGGFAFQVEETQEGLLLKPTKLYFTIGKGKASPISIRTDHENK